MNHTAFYKIKCSMVFLAALFFCVSLSVDALVAGVTYGAKGIRVSFRVVVAIGVACGLAPALAIMLSGALSEFTNYAKALSFCVLVILGLIKIFDRQLNAIVNKLKRPRYGIINIFVKPEGADIDNSKAITIGEGLLLSLALSMDAVAAGAFSGLKGFRAASYVFILSLFLTIAAIRIGQLLGRRCKIKGDAFSYIGGILLIFLAFFNIIF